MKRYVALVAIGLMLLGLCGTAEVRAEENTVPSRTTLDNLLTAYNSESNSHVRYLMFAEKAALEGYDPVASLFRAIAFAEQVRYERYAAIIKKLGGNPVADIEEPVVKSTRENLEFATNKEAEEARIMYKDFLSQAKKENIKDAIDAFEDAQAAESVYGNLFAQGAKNLDLAKGLVKDFLVCPACGNVTDAITWSRCPICGTDARKFKRIK